MALSKNTKLFSLASFLTDVSSEMLIPILPYVLTTVLGAPVIAVSLFEAVKETIAKVIGIVSGFYSDKIGRRKNTVIAGYGISAFMKGLLMLVAGWQQIVGILLFERVGKGVRESPRDSLIVLSEKKENLGKAFGFRKMLDNFGAILGPVLASIIIIAFGNAPIEQTYKNIFIISFIPAVIAVAVLFFIDEIKTKGQDGKKILKELNHDGNFKKFIIAQAIFALGNFGISLFLLRAGNFVAFAIVPLVYLGYNIFYTTFSMPAGIIADKIGPKKTLVIGYFIYLVALVGLIQYADSSSIIVMFALLGLFMAINEVAPNVMVGRLVEKEVYGSAIGLSKGLTGWIALPANIIAGALWTVYGPNTAFLFGIVTTIISIGAMMFFVRD
ncbi:MAG: MFS transporter [Candidatus Micrarchaeota archaeon]|nr:MFS transporter [Candidatus Micrarchaeota archaeon]